MEKKANNFSHLEAFRWIDHRQMDGVPTDRRCCIPSHGEVKRKSDYPLPSFGFNRSGPSSASCSRASASLLFPFERIDRSILVGNRQVMPEASAHDAYENADRIAIDACCPRCGCDEVSEVCFAVREPLGSRCLGVEPPPSWIDYEVCPVAIQLPLKRACILCDPPRAD
jgi:hypothetical protein